MGLPANLRSIAIATVAIATLTISQAGAQDGRPNPAERYQALTDSMVVRMALSGETEQAVRAIMAEHGQGLAEIFESYGGQRSPEMRNDIMALQEETEANLGIVLTADQMEQYHVLRREWREQMRSGGPRGQGQGRP